MVRSFVLARRLLQHLAQADRCTDQQFPSCRSVIAAVAHEDSREDSDRGERALAWSPHSRDCSMRGSVEPADSPFGPAGRESSPVLGTRSAAWTGNRPIVPVGAASSPIAGHRRRAVRVDSTLGGRIA